MMRMMAKIKESISVPISSQYPSPFVTQARMIITTAIAMWMMSKMVNPNNSKYPSRERLAFAPLKSNGFSNCFFIMRLLYSNRRKKKGELNALREVLLYLVAREEDQVHMTITCQNLLLKMMPRALAHSFLLILRCFHIRTSSNYS